MSILSGDRSLASNDRAGKETKEDYAGDALDQCVIILVVYTLVRVYIIPKELV